MGMSIPTTANAKAIVKQVKRALQVCRVYSSPCMFHCVRWCSICILMLRAEHRWPKEKQ